MTAPNDLQISRNATTAEEFLWPAPPYFEFDRAGDRDSLGECLLFLRDGTMVSGRLRNFFPDEALLTFQADGTTEPVNVPFSILLRLQMLRTLGLKREQSLRPPTGSEDPPRSERHPFRIELVNGEKFEGVTLGHVSAVCGLFLFLAQDNGGVIRAFVPTQAARTCAIDAPIGQVLIDQKAVSEEAVAVALNMQAMMRTQRLGAFLTGANLVSPEQLEAALEFKRKHPKQRLGEALLELGVMTRPELEWALETDASERTMPVGQILRKKMGIVDEQAINGAMANKLGIPQVSLGKVTIAPEIISKIPASTAYHHRIVPLCVAEGALVVATENPLDKDVLEDVRAITHMRVVPVSASADDITQSLTSYYGAAAADAFAADERAGRRRGGRSQAQALESATGDEIGIHDLMSRLAHESGNLDIAEQQAVRSDSALVRLVNRMILDAVQQKASDIHIEANPSPKTTRVRFRKDGTLVNYLELPAQFRNAVVSRIKIMSQLDITERRKPQDGKIDFSRFARVPVELRVATVPTTSGLEDVVMRVLAAAKPVPVDQLGLDKEALVSIQKLISKPHGLFIVCGPTGSGKTTTLHSLLAFLNTSERKIWTAEDPIEITQPGLRQVQVNSKIGWTFAAAMRSFMRADPDVIMVGEMRDAETAKIGIEASLTGHLVLTTLHTNSAPESLVRLLDLGMDPFNFADALLGVLAQRLTKRLCPDCKAAYKPASGELEELLAQYCAETQIDPGKQMKMWLERFAGKDGKITLRRARGCERCDQTGFRGRIGIYELLVADAAQKRLVQSRAAVAQVKSTALAAGMRTLTQNGIEKVLQGLTDIQQVRTVSS